MQRETINRIEILDTGELMPADHVAWSQVPEPERQAIARLTGGARR
jgi:hypothetical protein